MVFVSAGTTLLAFNAETGGGQIWTYEAKTELGAPVFNSAVNALYVTSGNRLLAFSSTGEALGAYEARTGEHYPFPPTVKERMLCIGSAPVDKSITQYTVIHVIRVGADGNLNI